MAKICDKCGKKPQVGHRVSHSNIKTLRRFEPNIQKRDIFDVKQDKMVKMKICTACLRTMVKVRPARNKKVRAAAVAA